MLVLESDLSFSSHVKISNNNEPFIIYKQHMLEVPCPYKIQGDLFMPSSTFFPRLLFPTDQPIPMDPFRMLLHDPFLPLSTCFQLVIEQTLKYCC